MQFESGSWRNRRRCANRAARWHRPACFWQRGCGCPGDSEIETAHPGYLGSQDTFYVGTLKGVGRIYQQTFVDTYSKWAAAKLYTTKTPITAADLLNDRVLPFFAEQGMGMIRILTDRGTEYCGKPESHDYQLYLALNDIEHTKTKANLDGKEAWHDKITTLNNEQLNLN